jgi:hypothetical protein
MLGKAIAAAPLGEAGLDTLTADFPEAQPERIRIDAVLRILAESADMKIGREQ